MTNQEPDQPITPPSFRIETPHDRPSDRTGQKSITSPSPLRRDLRNSPDPTASDFSTYPREQTRANSPRNNNPRQGDNASNASNSTKRKKRRGWFGFNGWGNKAGQKPRNPPQAAKPLPHNGSSENSRSRNPNTANGRKNPPQGQQSQFPSPLQNRNSSKFPNPSTTPSPREKNSSQSPLQSPPQSQFQSSGKPLVKSTARTKVKPPTKPLPQPTGTVSPPPRANKFNRGSKTAKRPPRKKVGTGATIVYGIRLLILGVGLGAIVGTLLYISDPALRPGNNTPKVITPATLGAAPPGAALPSANSQLTPLKLQQEVPALQGQLEALIKARPNIQTGVFLQDLDSGSFVNILGDSPFSAASTIKLPILLAFFQDVDARKISLSETLTLEKQFVAGGAGELQDQPLGTKYTALDVATRMMVGSDNTATNMLIARLGGIPVLNQRFQGWGLKNTTLQAVLPDLGGTNLTTPKELATILAAVDQGELVSRRSRDLVLSIMQRTENDSLLPQGLEKNAAIAHKTGSLGELLADAGLIDTPNGKHYLLVVIVKRPRNDPRGAELIRQISRTVYTYFKQIPPSVKP